MIKWPLSYILRTIFGQWNRIDFVYFITNNRNITNRYYAIAYTKDYSDISLDGEKIDSTNSMNSIQQKAYKMCVKEDIEDELRMSEECYRE